MDIDSISLYRQCYMKYREYIYIFVCSAIVFGCGWALSENLKVNQKVPTKRITEHVKGLLTIMFHSSTANPRIKMDANEMHEEKSD